ncbi:MAG: hypothetical protein PHS79_06010 [Patescibacteria group bacterium]|nr:hypothetical protein [Patescibacteria group bacterium]
MLIICTGPDTFLARQKVRDLMEAYRQKHVSTGAVIERLETSTSIQDAISKLSNLGLFATKRLLKYENLFAGITPAQAKKFIQTLTADDNQTVVLTYEDKPPTKKILDLFQKENLFIYAHESLKGTALNKWIVDRCKTYNIATPPTSKLVELFSDNLWAIDTALQSIQVLNNMTVNENGLDNDVGAFALIDEFMQNNPNWRSDFLNNDPHELLPILISQIINWNRIKDRQADDVHPYVQKKLSYIKFKDSNEMTLKIFRAMQASRNSLSQNQEIVQLLF